jgi:hypothetical protein
VSFPLRRTTVTASARRTMTTAGGLDCRTTGGEVPAGEETP